MKAPEDVDEARAPQERPARPLAIIHQGQLLRFHKAEIDRAHLYGRRHLVALDAQGRTCETALLTRDGQHLLRRGSTADLYLTEAGDAVERCDLVALEAAGASRAIRAPTTAQEPQPLEGPLPADELLDYVSVRVDALRAEVPAPSLAAALCAGSVFRVTSRSQRSAKETTAFLVGNGSGTFLVQGEPCGFGFIGPDELTLPDEAADDDGDEDPFAIADLFGMAL